MMFMLELISSTWLLSSSTDGVIIGVSCLEYLLANLDACEEGPLDERECRWQSPP